MCCDKFTLLCQISWKTYKQVRALAVGLPVELNSNDAEVGNQSLLSTADNVPQANRKKSMLRGTGRMTSHDDMPLDNQDFVQI